MKKFVFGLLVLMGVLSPAVMLYGILYSPVLFKAGLCGVFCLVLAIPFKPANEDVTLASTSWGLAAEDKAWWDRDGDPEEDGAIEAVAVPWGAGCPGVNPATGASMDTDCMDASGHYIGEGSASASFKD